MSPISKHSPDDFRLGECLVQPSRNRILRPDGEAAVEPKVMEVLLCLVEHAGQVVSREAIYQRVWGHTVVSDQALTNCISELRQHLGDQRAAPRYIETVSKRGYRLIAPVREASQLGSEADGSPAPARRRRYPSLMAVAALLAAALAIIASRLPIGGDAGASNSVAVLPFDNAADREALDYLRLAMPDEITTVLAEAEGLAVRPFEPARASGVGSGRASAEAAYLVTGHYYVEDEDRLTIAVEARDAAHERVVWRAQITVPAADVLALRKRMARRIREGLLPVLGVTARERHSEPADAEAYRLYLHSLAVPRDPGPNRRGIDILETAVERDPQYAPAWAALAERYHDYNEYGGGSAAYLDKARRAAKRALSIDPGLVAAAKTLIVLETESGALPAAYRRARALVARRGRSAAAHFSLAYVLRFGGMLQAAQDQCEQALALDPHYHGWRSCAFAYMAAGELERAWHFIALDAGSYWSSLVSVHYWLRRGDQQKALDYAERLPPDSVERRFHTACIRDRPKPPPDAITEKFIELWSVRDPEPAYWIASELVMCGREADGLALLRTAIDDGYCSYPGVDRDPAWQKVRERADFQRLREAARACHERFEGVVGAPR